MIPGMNPKKMQQMMQQMGVKQDDIEGVVRVEITTETAKILIEPAQVAEVEMMGQKTIQVTGDPQVFPLDTSAEISDEDVQAIVDQTGVSEEKAKDAIEKAGGDLAQAIMDLSE